MQTSNFETFRSKLMLTYVMEGACQEEEMSHRLSDLCFFQFIVRRLMVIRINVLFSVSYLQDMGACRVRRKKLISRFLTLKSYAFGRAFA